MKASHTTDYRVSTAKNNLATTRGKASILWEGSYPRDKNKMPQYLNNLSRGTPISLGTAVRPTILWVIGSSRGAAGR